MQQRIPHHAHGAPSARFGRLVRFSMASAVALAVSGMSTSAMAQAADPDGGTSKEVENSKFATVGIIQSNAVFVRCGPGDNYYPTMKLDKGAKVKVVGARFDWLKVVPPEGSFCYVAKLYVDRHGDGKVGRVNKDSINVRAGSSLSALKIGILCELRQNEDVEIIGEEQEYFKIKPPAAAYLYVNKKFVEPDPEAKPEAQVAHADQPKPPAIPSAPVPPVTTDVKPETGTGSTPAPGSVGASTGQDFGGGTAATPGAPTIAGQTGTGATPPATGGAGATGTPSPNTPDLTNPGIGAPATPGTGNTGATPMPPAGTGPTQGADPVPPTGTGAAPTTIVPQPPVEPVRPAAPEVSPEVAFDQAEGEYLATKGQALDKQPIDELLKKYEPLAKSDRLPESMRRVAEARVLTLKNRQTAQADLLKLRKSQDEMRQRQMALEAEQQELQKRVAETTVKFYTAVGTLQPSSLQQGTGGTLYRVTDPATGRTVCYLRSADKQVVTMLGQFVGVKGDLIEDPRLGGRVIKATELVAVEQGKVNQGVTAQIIPPSLLPKAASTDPQQ